MTSKIKGTSFRRAGRGDGRRRGEGHRRRGEGRRGAREEGEGRERKG